VVLFGMSNLGIDVGALIAGLGIGGIAVALAAQNILGDLLASLSIVLDKPFEVGDAISVGGLSGVVENIGLKTTRVRATTGEQLIFSNKDLLESRVQNFKRMWQRRVVLKIGVTYSTPESKLTQIPGWIKGFIEADETLRFDRAHFMNIGAHSLDFEVVFFVKSDSYQVYMDRQQALLLTIYNKFNFEKVEFAYPTQSIIVEKLPLQPHS
ncbi:MAG TPA: mechanosensitive ion channel family protein, partial [Bdellovibrio sp.]|nr:mechanosensitive ion channel family protein [Bdellovibrio sp.]